MKRLFFLVFCIFNVQNTFSQSQPTVTNTPLMFSFGVCGSIQTNIYDNNGNDIINGYGGLGLRTDMSIELSRFISFLWGGDIIWLSIRTTNGYDIYKTTFTDVENIEDSREAVEGIGCLGGSMYIGLSFKLAISNYSGVLTAIGLQCSWQEEKSVIDIEYTNMEILEKVDFNKKTTDIGPMIDISFYTNHNNYRNSAFSVGIHGSLALFRGEETYINTNRIYLGNKYIGFEIMPYISWNFK
jgi:hypothetical protein